LLLHRGANLEAVTEQGYTALHIAAMQGYPDVAKELLKRSANVSAVTQKYHTALHIATMKV